MPKLEEMFATVTIVCDRYGTEFSKCLGGTVCV